MFYCEECRERNDWPESAVRSTGPCGNCGEYRICHDGRDRRKEKTMELMEWTKERPEEDGFYWAYAKGWGEMKPVLIEVKGESYRPVRTERWMQLDDVGESYVYAGPLQPPSIDAVMVYKPERRGAERVRV